MDKLKNTFLSKCVHFNGVMNKTCKAGVNYDEVKEGRPFRFPCLNQGGQCSRQQFPTPEEAEARENEILEIGTKALQARLSITARIKNGGGQAGQADCPCGGKINYISASNGHIRAKCPTCGLSFME